ncbi:putative nucleotide-binding alpha-beta plait domain superfamily, RNA-binding domain superfamily [Helianthus annuus]|nr:putative nucleotide-binding alpha-beta plait domain superfamily, RNA-binding domain superfamily [Helianthus annuus]
MEARLQNTTSFFISNLPDGCDKASLWSAFEHLDNLEDDFVPYKKDRSGNKFGFIKLSNVSDPAWWMEKLKEVRIDGAVLGVNLAWFNRDGSKIVSMNGGNRVSVFSRLQGLHQPPKAGKIPGTKVPFNSRVPASIAPSRFEGKSYCSVVSRGGIKNPISSMALTPMNTELKKSLEFKSLVGEVKDIDILNDLTAHLSGITEQGFKLKYLGGLKVLLCFFNSEDAEDFRLNMVNGWEKWFSMLYIWDGLPPIFERVAWIKILGVPVCLWDRHVFNRIGERCGRLLVKSEVEESNGNLAEERLAVLVNSGSRVSAEFGLSWKDHNLKIRVEEISGQWTPVFLEDEVVIPGIPARSSEVGGSPLVGDDKSVERESPADSESDQQKSLGVKSPSTCMDTPNASSPVFEDNMSAHGLKGDLGHN